MINIELAQIISRSNLSRNVVRREMSSDHLPAIRSGLGGTWSSDSETLDWLIDRAFRGLALNAECRDWLSELSGAKDAARTLIRFAGMERTIRPFHTMSGKASDPELPDHATSLRRAANGIPGDGT
jgi:hypothetical protein